MQIIPCPFANELVDELMNVEKSSDSTEDKLEEEVVIREEVAAQEEIAATTLADEQASMSEQEQMPLKEEPDIRSSEGPKVRSEEHTSELQSRGHLVCRLL